jgi:hypothetical protein
MRKKLSIKKAGNFPRLAVQCHCPFIFTEPSGVPLVSRVKRFATDHLLYRDDIPRRNNFKNFKTSEIIPGQWLGFA